MITSSSDRVGARYVAPEHAAAAVRLGARVQALRAERGFSPQEFAALAAVSTADLSALESGGAGTSLAVLMTVAEALDLDVAELFAAAPTPSPQQVMPPPQIEPAPAHPATAPASRAYVTTVAPASRPAREAAPAPARAGVPRTFADLRQGALAGRNFPTLPHFAVAAVVEAGHAVSVIARIFRVPAWKLEAWVRDGVAEPPVARARQWS